MVTLEWRRIVKPNGLGGGREYMLEVSVQPGFSKSTDVYSIDGKNYPIRVDSNTEKFKDLTVTETRSRDKCKSTKEFEELIRRSHIGPRPNTEA